MNSITSLSAQQLRHAAEIKDKIQSLENELNKILGSPAKSPAIAPALKKRRKMSAAGRARIAATAKARWAKIKGGKSNAAPAQKQKRQMSAAARAKISAAAKARWAKIKAGTNLSKPTPSIPKLMRKINQMKERRLRLERETREKLKEATK